MSNLAFLAIALVVSVVGSAYLVFRRRTPESPHSSIDAFADRMTALDPTSEDRVRIVRGASEDAGATPASDEPGSPTGEGTGGQSNG